MSTAHRAMSGKELSYVRLKLLHTGHSYMPFIHMPFLLWLFFNEQFYKQFTYAVFHIQNHRMCLDK